MAFKIIKGAVGERGVGGRGGGTRRGQGRELREGGASPAGGGGRSRESALLCVPVRCSLDIVLGPRAPNGAGHAGRCRVGLAGSCQPTLKNLTCSTSDLPNNNIFWLFDEGTQWMTATNKIHL